MFESRRYDQLKSDLAKVQDGLAELASNSGSAAANSARYAGETVASEVEDVDAPEPAWAVVASFAIGVLVGIMTRGFPDLSSRNDHRR